MPVPVLPASRRVALITMGVLTALLLAGVLLTNPSRSAEAAVLDSPPPGGLTIGFAGSGDPASVAAAQPFEVHSVWLLEPAAQEWLTYLPGAPAAVNSLDAGLLREDSVVVVRRDGAPAAPGPVPEPPADANPSGEAQTLQAPPSGGMTQGVSGTNDPRRLAEAQAFGVTSVSVLHVESQQWLTYVVGAPAWANSLVTGLLTPESIVTVRRGSGPTVEVVPAPTQAPEPTPEAIPDPSEVDATPAEQQMLDLVNAERTELGAVPLRMDAELLAVARAHSSDMWERGFFAHTNPDGLDPFDRLRAAGVDYSRAAENIVRTSSVERAHAMLMDSGGHRGNLLNEQYGRAGIGVMETPNGLYITQVFAN